MQTINTPILNVETIDDYRKMRAITRGVTKRDRSKLKRQVKLNTMRKLSNKPSGFSFQVRRVYRKLWHEAVDERERTTLAWSAIHATA